MQIFVVYGRRLLEWLCLTAIGRGIMLFLATNEIYPDKFVASLITDATEAPVWAEWIISGSFGLLLTCTLEILFWNRRSSLARTSDMNPGAYAIAARPFPAVAERLQILTGTGDEFETRRPAGLYMTNHTFSACVENGNPTQFRSNCKLYLNISN